MASLFDQQGTITTIHFSKWKKDVGGSHFPMEKKGGIGVETSAKFGSEY